MERNVVRKPVEERLSSGCGFYLRSSEGTGRKKQNTVFWKRWLCKDQGLMRHLTDITVSGLYYSRMVGMTLFLNWETEDHRYPGGEAGLKVRPRAVMPEGRS